MKRFLILFATAVALIGLPAFTGGSTSARTCPAIRPHCKPRPTTTTAAPTTTAVPTTTTTTTTTTIAATTTTSPPGTLFAEDFTGDTMADFTGRFDWSVADLARRPSTPWQGQHDMMCHGPDTERTIVHGPAYDSSTPAPEFWLCAPGGLGTDHLMTTNGQDAVFGVTAFSPKQSFTGNRVCWDVNLTVSPGRRRWWEVQILPANYVSNAISLVRMGVSVQSADSERGTAFLAWGAGVGGTLQNRILPLNGLIWDYTEEINHVWRGNEPDPNTAGFDVSQAATMILNPDYSTRFVTTDRATRDRHCWTDDGNGTMTIRQARPGLPDFVRTIAGSFPKPFRVIFADHNYDSGKDGSLFSQTFHWDNILVAAS
jgi:hypothetical protein